MKKFIQLILMFGIFVVFLGILCIAISCKPSQATCTEIPRDTIFVETVRIDTIKVIDQVEADSLALCLFQARDSLHLYRDSISYEDFLNARRVEKIKYYISICEKKPTNKKFFYGWIKRTMTE